VKHVKVKQGIVSPLCLLLMLIFVGASAKAAPREYAVQIAAVRSPQVADDMRSGLRVQGLEAYWVKAVLPEHGMFYRVRLGKFPSIETAYTYAEVLLNTGLLESYAITAYEPPMSGPLRDMTQASLEVQEYIQQGPTPKETSELFAALGARQWMLPSSRNLFGTTPQVAPQTMGMNRREVLVFALSSHEWRVTPDPSIFFVRAPVVASTVDLAVNPASPKFEAAPAARAVTPASNTPPALTPPPRPNQPAPNNGFGAERNAAADIGRGGNKPTTGRGVNPGARNLGQARLQATAEMRNGQLVMKLRNMDSERSFTGTARVTLSDDKNSSEVLPMQFNLAPEAEVVLPINDPVSAGSNWMLMVFDDANALRLVRGASIGQKAPAVAQQNSPSPSDQSSLNPPPYVTGVYDATNAPAAATQPAASATAGMVPPSESSNLANNVSGQGPTGASNAAPPNTPAGGDVPAQLTITPRQIAVTTENVTLEFDIAAPNPLNYISVTLAAGEYRDVRQALMSSTRGRVPFLAPAAQATGTFVYEIKDEGGRVLGGGVGDFRQLAGR